MDLGNLRFTSTGASPERLAPRRGLNEIAGLSAIVALTLLLAGPVPVVRADSAFRPGDVFELRLGGVPSDEITVFNNIYTIDGSGALNLPHIGRIPVAGLTAGQIQSKIETTYRAREIYTNPTVTLVTSQSPRYVNVAGAVKTPTRVLFTADMTVISAITAAGDFNDFANQRRVLLIRNGQRFEVNAKEARKDPSKDMKVLPGDQIQVPQSIF